MKRTFIIETNKADSRGDLINLAGVHMPEKVPVTVEWDHSKFIGMATVVNTGDTLKATAEIPDKFVDGYPAIGFMPINYENNGKGKTYHEIKLYQVSICTSPNPNHNIKTIKEQSEEY